MKDYKELIIEKFRRPMVIVTYKEHYDKDPMCYFRYFECPRCKHLIERDYQAYCSACGQRLYWDYS